MAKKGSKKSNSDLDSLEDAFDMELPIEGRVTEICNGGFRVTVNNKVAFCPVSQMDIRVTDQQAYLDKNCITCYSTYPKVLILTGKMKLFMLIIYLPKKKNKNLQPVMTFC